MPCCQKKQPPPPENADQLDVNKKPINNKCGPVTFGWVRPVIKNMKKRKAMYYCDIYPLSNELKSQHNGKQMVKQWNFGAIRYQKRRKILEARGNDKKQKIMKPGGILTMLHRECWPNFLSMYVTVALTSLCNVCSPICVQQFTSILVPQFFYDCSAIFNPNPQLITYPYSSGLNNLMLDLYGYLLLVIIALCLSACFQNLSYHMMGRVMIKFTTGTMDLVYQKMLTLSEQARTSTAGGNITNILFTDSNNIQLLLQFMPVIVQIPVDMMVYIIYLAVEVNPVSLAGLLILAILIPAMLCLLQGILKVAKRSLSLKDTRVEKTTEVLNGIKVIKLFGLELVQEARISNVRKKEMKNLYKRSVYMTLLNMCPSLLAPLMCTIAFIILMYTNQFDLTTAFTTMFLLQYLALSMVMIPMLMGFVMESSVSSNRICAFLNMSEQDPGVVVRTNTLTMEQKDKISSIISNDDAIKITGRPSFTWSLAEDKIVPDILDPFFKENSQKLRNMKRIFPRTLKRYKQQIQKLTINIQEDPVLSDDEKNILINVDAQPDINVLERWCVDLKVPSVIRTTKITQYNPRNYSFSPKDLPIVKLKHQNIHLQIMKKLIAKSEGADFVDDAPVLKNIDITVKKGELIGLCGPVGCSKSSFFTALLGEMRVVQEQRAELNKYKISEYKPQHYDYGAGVEDVMHQKRKLKDNNLQKEDDDPRFNEAIPHIYISGNVAYFQQTCSILSRTVQDNITFGKPFDKQKYDEIVKICCLEDDFKILQNGDQTLIGGKGVTLSGGQKARVTLARAVYSDSDVYLLDDPLSAVDSHVGQKLWSDVILGYLVKKHKTVIIASHQTQYFSDCDKIIQMHEGQIVNYDTPTKLIHNNAGILGLQEQRSDAWNKVHAEMNQELQNKEYDVKEVMNADGQSNSEYTTSQSSQSQINAQQDGKLNNALKADKLTDTGTIKCSVYGHWCAHGSILLGIAMILGIVFYQAIAQYQTVLITHWTADEYGWSQSVVQDQPTISCGTTSSEFCQQYGNMETMAGQLIANGATADDAAMGLMKCYPEVGFNFDMQIKSSTTYLWTYFALTFGIMLFNYIGFQALNAFGLFVSSKLHNKMLKSLIETKMAFFDTTEFGRITNRISKDVDSLDNRIQQFLMSVIQTFFQLLAMVITMAALSWPCLIIIIPCIAIFIAVFIDFRNLYPIIKRLEATSRSPVLNICQETIDNLVTLKAYQSQPMMSKDFRTAVDINGTLFYQQFAIMRWMTFKLNILTAFFAFFICLICCLLAPWNQQIAQYTGVIVSYSFSVTNLLFQFVQAFVQLEGEMSSTERLLEYSNLPPEGSYTVDVKEVDENSQNSSKHSGSSNSISHDSQDKNSNQQRLITPSVEVSSEYETVNQQMEEGNADNDEEQQVCQRVDDVENQAIALPKAKDNVPIVIPHNWPRKNSKIEIRHLNFRYRPELELTLHDVTFSIQPGEHIGVVGRTGAGKSSITVALYRLAEPEAGTEILVDNVNILNLGLHQARSAFTIIPQEPFLFSGTIRQSLCPYSQAEAEGADTTGLTRIPDVELWRVLNQVGLGSYMKSVPGGLEATVQTNGDNLSAGQRQLVCVARALLRKSALAILDEATAAVDRDTDKLIQQAVREALQDTAVLAIAHRLDTVIDFHKILVVDFGRIAEFDTPANLLRKSDSIFSQLVDNTGPEFSQYLRRCAFQAEEDRKKGIATTILPPEPGCQDLSIVKSDKSEKESMQSATISQICNSIDNSVRKDLVIENSNILTAEQQVTSPSTSK